MWERPRRNIVSFDVLIAFQMPGANPRWNPPRSHPYHRHRAIAGNVPVTGLRCAGRAEFHLRTHPLDARVSLSPRLSPKRLLNWSRILFVIRCALLPWFLDSRFDTAFSFSRSSFFLISSPAPPFHSARLIPDVRGMRPRNCVRKSGFRDA